MRDEADTERHMTKKCSTEFLFVLWDRPENNKKSEESKKTYPLHSHDQREFCAASNSTVSPFLAFGAENPCMKLCIVALRTQQRRGGVDALKKRSNASVTYPQGRKTAGSGSGIVETRIYAVRRGHLYGRTSRPINEPQAPTRTRGLMRREYTLICYHTIEWVCSPLTT